MSVSLDKVEKFIEAIHSDNKVSDYTHDLYRYPARFSPEFARWAIQLFTEQGDWVVDPFMGGGTSLVEAKALNRNSIGTDVNSLAVFLAKTKIQYLERDEILEFRKWALDSVNNLNCNKSNKRPTKWIELGYQTNINTIETWPIRKLIEQALLKIEELNDIRIERYYRCSILKTGQWALDSKKEVPSVDEFRSKLRKNIKEISSSAIQFSEKIKTILDGNSTAKIPISIPYNKSATCLSELTTLKDNNVRLILTSPPYPGVHILYHRWQVMGRRETPAPYWIANSYDGEAESYYTLGSRHQDGLTDYFDNIKSIFKKIRSISSQGTTIVQLISFSEPDWQLDKYLKILKEVGFREKYLDGIDNRIWRNVPNRKWYTNNGDEYASSKETVLIHEVDM